MKSFIVAFLAGLAAAAPSPAPEAGELTWTGSIQDGGPNRTFTGTIESVFNQVMTANRNFEPEPVPETVATSGLQKRTAYNCDIFGDIPANADAGGGTITQINYLYGLSGYCGFTPTCTRVSCSYDNAIFACSRTGGDYSVPCTELADRASGILGRCQRGGKVWGQAAEPNYFVDVHSADC